MVIMVVTIGLSFLDFTLAFTLGGIMLLTLFLMPPLFYRAGKSTGQNRLIFAGSIRQQLTAWLQGQAELTIFGASDSLSHAIREYRNSVAGSATPSI